MVASSQRIALLNKYRYINVEFDNWWDCVEADFVEDMKKIGVHVDKLYFSGFCSQGDGACFVGSLSNALTYLDHHHKDQFPMIRKLLEHGGGVYAVTTHRGNYCHSNSVTINVETDRFYQCLEAKSELQERVIEQWDELLYKEVDDFENAISDQWRTYMNDVYRKLEAEYDYLTSDEAVWETLEANELVEDVDDDEYFSQGEAA